MNTLNEDARSLFFEALELDSEDDLRSFLQTRCGENTELRERVECLIRANQRAGQFLGGSFACDLTADLPQAVERIGTSIGPYKLMEPIGEGGMGTVFVAQQEAPIRRKVALKLIKPGMDTKSVVARFEAERQALAMMDHPNIATVLDAGTTESGRPYFAMELVRGVPITDYCDRNRLPVDERLELFVKVCGAIQHAHQKGIIHRDIKPSNVLVTLHDGKPIPKVIDFGVAKAVNARLTDKTIYTEHFQIVGTLLYMSPEQAELSGLDVDTRSDIYSLGVLLYELLTGTTPFQKHDLMKAGFDEQRRMIRECDPPRASVRISTLGETATAVADARKTDIKRLRDRVRGDLDWVVLKSLDKDRTRRYESAAGFGRDVARYLANEAVLAHPPSAAYRARKYVSQNRAALGAVTGIILALAIGMGLAIWQKREAIAKTQALVAAQNEGKEFTEKLEQSAIESAWTAAWFGDEQRVKDALEGVRSNRSFEAEILRIEGLLQYTLGHLEPAREHFEAALELDGDDFFSQAFLATTAINAGESARFAIECHKLNAMTPTDDYDQLALASVEVFRDPFRALEIVEGVGNGVRGVGKLFVRTEANAHAGFDSGSLEYCDRALADIEHVELVLGPSSNTLCVRLLMLTFGMYVAKSKGELERADEYSARAKKVNQDLIDAGYDDSLAHSIQWHYYQYGPEPNRELAWQAVKQVKTDADYVINIAVERMMNEADPRNALRDFDAVVGEVNTPYAQFARALLMCSLPDESANVRQIAMNLSKPEPGRESVVFKRFAMFLFALLGEGERAKRVAEDVLRTGESRYMGAELHCIEGFAKPDEFKGFATLGDRRRLDFTLSELTRGLLAISRGDRSKALEAFESAQKSQLKIYYLDMYATAFANQMRLNPDWPLVGKPPSSAK